MPKRASPKAPAPRLRTIPESEMTPQQLATGHEHAWKRVYRAGAIARRLWKARACEPLALAANLGYRFYAHNLHRFYTCDWHLTPLPGLTNPTVEVARRPA